MGGGELMDEAGGRWMHLVECYRCITDKQTNDVVVYACALQLPVVVWQ